MLAFTMTPACAQEFNTRGTENQASQPSVMVVPYINAELDGDADKLRTYMDTNPMIKVCISKVKEAFSAKGYPTRDLLGQLRKNQNRKLISASKSATSSAAKSAVLAAKADICVYLTPLVIKNANGSMEVRITLDAQEAQTGQSFANADFNSGSYQSTDTITMAETALAIINTKFFYQVEDGFNQMLEEGRDVSILIEFAEECEVGPYTKVGTAGKTFDREMMDWTRKTAYKGSGNSESADGMVEISMKIPVYEVGTDVPFQLGLVSDMLREHLEKLLGDLAGVEPVVSQGQNIQFIIKK